MNKFDVVFSNPPYTKKLDVNVVKDALQFSDKIIVVMTDRVLYRQSMKRDRSLLNKYMESIYHVGNGNELFGIDIWCDEAVLVLNKNKKNVEINVNNQYFINNLDWYDKLGELNKEEMQYINELKDIKEVRNSLLDNCTEQYLKDDFKVSFYLAGGSNALYKGLTSLISKEERVKHIVFPTDVIKPLTKEELRFYFYFNNVQQVEDFKYSYRRIVFLWYLNLYKPAHTISKGLLRRIPFVKGRLENEDWKRILQMPDSLYKKIVEKYDEKNS